MDLKNKEHLLTILHHVTKDLINIYGMAHSDILNNVRSFLINDSKSYPYKKVMYNDCYGVYNYSFSFQKYLDDHNVSRIDAQNIERIHDALYICQFGHNVLDKYPLIKNMLFIYTHYDLGNVFKKIKQAKYRNEKPVIPSMSETMIENIIHSLDYYFDAEQQDMKSPFFKRKNWRHKHDNQSDPMEFEEAIKHYGETHWAIWKCQMHYDEQAMRFLILFPSSLSIPSLDDDTKTEVYEKAGLLFASGKFSKLQIAEVPALVDWSLTSYQGLETVNLV